LRVGNSRNSWDRCSANSHRDAIYEISPANLAVHSQIAIVRIHNSPFSMYRIPSTASRQVNNEVRLLQAQFF
jgi:hypothetical protein